MQQKTITIDRVTLGILEVRGIRIMLPKQIASLHGLSDNYAFGCWARNKTKFNDTDTFTLTWDEAKALGLHEPGRVTQGKPRRVFSKSGYLKLIKCSTLRVATGIPYFDDDADAPKAGVQLPPPTVTAKTRAVDDEILDFASKIVEMRNDSLRYKSALCGISLRLKKLIATIDEVTG